MPRKKQKKGYKTKRGKYHDWITRDGLTQIEGWARDGLTNEQIAANIGIAAATLYDWIRKYPEIDEALKRGKAPVDIEVENALLKSALGYEEEQTKQIIVQRADGETETRIEKTTKHYPPNVTAIIFWLKNRRPDIWTDRKEIDARGEFTQVIFEDEDAISE